MVLPTKAQLSINAKMRTGTKVPQHIYIKRKKGRPAKDIGGGHEYYTPVFITGNIDEEVIQFFMDENDTIQELMRLAEEINT